MTRNLQPLRSPRHPNDLDNRAGWSRLARSIARAQARNRCAALAARLGQLRAEERILRAEVTSLEARIRAMLK